jgi:hypothetical protein
MKMQPIVIGLSMPMTDGFINVRIEVDGNGKATAQYYTEADLEANPEDPWSDGFGDIQTRVALAGSGELFDEKHRFIPFSKERIADFLDRYAEKVIENESNAHVELMMDDHTCINYYGVGYYLPENNSFLTSEDEEVLEYLNNTHYV